MKIYACPDLKFYLSRAPGQVISYPYYILINMIRETILQEITQQDVHGITLTLKIHRAYGIDGISHRLLHESVMYISRPLCIILP